MNPTKVLEFSLYHGVFLLTGVVIVTLLARFFWIQSYQWQTCNLYYSALIVVFGYTWVPLLCLYKARNKDPGTIKPLKKSQMNYEECQKCGAQRIERAHHCRQCQACVLLMDHHCHFTGKCVGKYNLKFFLQFCFHQALLLFIGLMYLITLITIQNIPNKVGIQGITWVIYPTPYCLLEFYHCYFGVSECHLTSYRIIDNALLSLMLGFGFFAFYNGFACFQNVLNNTSQPLKLKYVKTKPRTKQQAFQVIFGDRCRWYDYVLPTDPIYQI